MADYILNMIRLDGPVTADDLPASKVELMGELNRMAAGGLIVRGASGWTASRREVTPQQGRLF